MRQFVLTDSQEIKIQEWKASLPKRPYGFYGGGVEYVFHPTGIGVAVKVRDCYSGQELDVTDYESW